MPGKRLIVAVVVIIGLLALILGANTLIKYLKAGRGAVADEIRKATPDAVIFKMAENELRDMQEALSESKVRLIMLDHSLKEQREKLDRKRGDLDRERSILRRARKLLASDSEQVMIGGETYTKKQLAFNAERHASRYERLREQIKSASAAIRQMEAIKEEGLEQLRDGELLLAQKTDELETLKIRLANAKDAKELEALRTELRGLLPSGKTMGLTELKRRVLLAESKVGSIDILDSGGTINWDDTTSSKRALRRIDALDLDAADDGTPPTKPTPQE